MQNLRMILEAKPLHHSEVAVMTTLICEGFRIPVGKQTDSLMVVASSLSDLKASSARKIIKA